MPMIAYTVKNIGKFSYYVLGNISKRWENFTNLLSCRKFFPWNAEIIPQKRKYVHFFWIFFHLNYEIYQCFLINWIFLRPNSTKYFQFYVRNIHLYFKLSDYFRKNFRKISSSVYVYICNYISSWYYSYVKLNNLNIIA